MADIAVNVLDDIVVSPELVIMGLEAETDQEAIIWIGILKKPVRFRTMGELDGALDVQLMFMLAINKPDKQLDFLSHMIDSCQKEVNLSGIYHAADPTEAAERFKKFF